MQTANPISLRRVAEGPHTAAIGDDLWCSTDAGQVVITAPGEPQHGEAFGLMRFGAHPIVVQAGGNPIGEARADNLVVNRDRVGLWFVWDGTEGRWTMNVRSGC